MFDVNLWYSYDNDSKTLVATKKVEYNDLLNLKIRENADLTNDTDIIVRTLNQPNCSNVSVDGNTINFDIEKELGIELVGDTKMKIAIEDDEEPWDILDDEVTNETLEEIDNTVDENYL